MVTVCMTVKRGAYGGAAEEPTPQSSGRWHRRLRLWGREGEGQSLSGWRVLARWDQPRQRQGRDYNDSRPHSLSSVGSRKSSATSAPPCATCPQPANSLSASWRPRISRRWTWAAFQVRAALLAVGGWHQRARHDPSTLQSCTTNQGENFTTGEPGCLPMGQPGSGFPAPLPQEFPSLSLICLLEHSGHRP